MNSIMKLVLVIIIVVMPAALAGVKPLKNPEPVPIPSGLTQSQVVNAIKKGMSRRNWRVQKEEAGKILALIYVRSHIVKVNIIWDEKDVHISYFDSMNMKYQMRTPRKSSGNDEWYFGNDAKVEEEAKPVPYIHDRYISWTNNLANDIRVELDLAGSTEAK